LTGKLLCKLRKTVYGKFFRKPFSKIRFSSLSSLCSLSFSLSALFSSLSRATEPPPATPSHPEPAPAPRRPPSHRSRPAHAQPTRARPSHPVVHRLTDRPSHRSHKTAPPLFSLAQTQTPTGGGDLAIEEVFGFSSGDLATGEFFKFWGFLCSGYLMLVVVTVGHGGCGGVGSRWSLNAD
jgi:hypothetical protein